MEEETNVAASAEVSAPEPMSFDSALERLNAADTPVEETPSAEPEAAAAEPEVPEAEDAAAPEEQEADATPEADQEDDFIHGNARTRLRDGTVTTVAELKKAFDEAKEYRAKQAEFDAKRQEYEAKQAQIAAQEQLFTNTVNQAKAVLQANFPPKPDESLLEQGDTFTYMEQKAKYDAAVDKWRRLDYAQKQQAQQAQAQQQEAVKQRVSQEIQLLKDAVPELRTDDGFKAFREEILTHAPKEYGYSAEEIGNLVDHRALRVLKDAIAYRKLQADKAKVAAKVKDVPPVAKVQAPGRRVEPAERQAQTVKSGFEALRKTGSFDDALRILNSME